MAPAPDAFEQLQQVLDAARREEDFPDWLAAEIQAIVGQPGDYTGKEPLIRILTGQISDFDLYAGCGCFSDSCGISDLERTLRQLKP